MKTKQTKQTPNNSRYDLSIERKITAPCKIIFCSPAKRLIKNKPLLDVYHEIVLMKEPMLKTWILANCKFKGKQPKNDYLLHTILPASERKLDKYLATDPLGLAEEAAGQKWTDTKTIVVDRSIRYEWKVSITK